MTTGSAKNKIQLLHSEKLDQLPWLVHAFSTRTGGVSRVYGGNALNLGFTKHDTPAAVERNRALFFKKLGIPQDSAQITRPNLGHSRQGWPLITLRQIHSDLVRHLSGSPDQSLAGDGMITDTPNILLAVQTADCLPVIVVDRKRRAVGVFHAGWRGTVKRIVEKGVGEMRRSFNSNPRDLIAAIGPGIQKCCYEVGEEVRNRFEGQFAYASTLFHEVKESDPVRERYPLLFLTARAPGHSVLPVKIFLDLVEANRRQLMDAGVSPKNIEASAPCTACHSGMLFSFRADRGVTGRLLGVAGIRNT